MLPGRGDHQVLGSTLSLSQAGQEAQAYNASTLELENDWESKVIVTYMKKLRPMEERKGKEESDFKSKLCPSRPGGHLGGAHSPKLRHVPGPWS